MKIAGDTVEQPDLARTLHIVAKYGPDYLYVTMADTIAKGMTHALNALTVAVACIYWYAKLQIFCS
jgi:gamma-glutamyltranspeptidase